MDLITKCQALGLNVNRVRNGYPCPEGVFVENIDGDLKAFIDRSYAGHEPWEEATGFTADLAVIQALLVLPQDETGFLSLDLESDKYALVVKSLVTADQWDTFKTLQTDRIRELRKAAYTLETDGLFLASQYDEAGTDDWKTAVAGIKARYPWPGDYR